jgi:antitoxin ParD1/3/4
MSINLGDPFDKFVSDLIQSGRYASQEEVLRVSLQLLQEREMDRVKQMDEWRAKIQVGIDCVKRGEVSELNMDEIRERARKEFESRQRQGER